jgi:phage-related protein
MSFFYDRDQNISGSIPATLAYTPSYGATVEFSADLSAYTTTDNYMHIMPKGLNHLQMKMNLPFENKKQEDARKILGYIESLNGTGNFLYTDPAQIYKPIRMFCDNIENSFNENDLHTVSVSLSSDQAASLLKWDTAYITGSNMKGEYSTGVAYSRFDVVRNIAANANNLYDSFYYVTGDISVGENTAISNAKFTKEFFFQPTYPAQISKETSVIKTELPYSFTKRTDFGMHANVLKSLKLDFKGVSDNEARCILHFLCGKQGYRKFQYKLPKIYDQNKYFFSNQWSHTFVYKNVNDISVTIIEDPLGARKVY